MNYGELKTAVLESAHRPDLSAHVARFVRECEGMIRRDLRGYALTYTLDEDDRLSGGLYTLPSTVIEMRNLIPTDRQGDGLTKMSPTNVRRISTTADPLWFADYGNGTIEIRGTPGIDAAFDLLYFGHPVAFSDDGDENALLTDHETLYLSGSRFFLYLHSQDRELANDELDIFNGVLKTLNSAGARKTGGASVAPTYNFSGGSSY